MLIAAIVIASVILIALDIYLFIGYVYKSKFKPNVNKLEQQRKLNEDIAFAGFAYQMNEDYFYSLMDCWQRSVGYCKAYDDGAPFFNMIIDCEPIMFSYGGKRWLVELWKGQYGITTGGEIGVYNTVREDIDISEFQGTFYENIKDEERLDLSFVLRKNGKVLIKRSGLHWWLTGFKLGEFSEPSSLEMNAKIKFPNHEMLLTFIEALKNVGYTSNEFYYTGNTITINYTKPYSPQSSFRNKVQESVVQQMNEANCNLYELATSEHTDTLDKIEYLKYRFSILYDLFIKSLYVKELYENIFEKIKEYLDSIDN